MLPVQPTTNTNALETLYDEAPEQYSKSSNGHIGSMSRVDWAGTISKKSLSNHTKDICDDRWSVSSSSSEEKLAVAKETSVLTLLTISPLKSPTKAPSFLSLRTLLSKRNKKDLETISNEKLPSSSNYLAGKALSLSTNIKSRKKSKKSKGEKKQKGVPKQQRNEKKDAHSNRTNKIPKISAGTTADTKTKKRPLSKRWWKLSQSSPMPMDEQSISESQPLRELKNVSSEKTLGSSKHSKSKKKEKKKRHSEMKQQRNFNSSSYVSSSGSETTSTPTGSFRIQSSVRNMASFSQKSNNEKKESQSVIDVVSAVMTDNEIQMHTAREDGMPKRQSEENEEEIDSAIIDSVLPVVAISPTIKSQSLLIEKDIQSPYSISPERMPSTQNQISTLRQKKRELESRRRHAAEAPKSSQAEAKAKAMIKAHQERKQKEAEETRKEEEEREAKRRVKRDRERIEAEVQRRVVEERKKIEAEVKEEIERRVNKERKRIELEVKRMVEEDRKQMEIEVQAEANRKAEDEWNRIETETREKAKAEARRDAEQKREQIEEARSKAKAEPRSIAEEKRKLKRLDIRKRLEIKAIRKVEEARIEAKAKAEARNEADEERKQNQLEVRKQIERMTMKKAEEERIEAEAKSTHEARSIAEQEKKKNRSKERKQLEREAMRKAEEAHARKKNEVEKNQGRVLQKIRAMRRNSIDYQKKIYRQTSFRRNSAKKRFKQGVLAVIAIDRLEKLASSSSERISSTAVSTIDPSEPSNHLCGMTKPQKLKSCKNLHRTRFDPMATVITSLSLDDMTPIEKAAYWSNGKEDDENLTEKVLKILTEQWMSRRRREFENRQNESDRSISSLPSFLSSLVDIPSYVGHTYTISIYDDQDTRLLTQ